VRHVVIGLLVSSLVVAPGVAHALDYRDGFRDPDDRPATGGAWNDPDIRYTARKVHRGDDHRRLTLTFWTYDPLPDWWTVIFKLDTRGGPLADYRLVMYDSDPSTGDPNDCWYVPVGTTQVRYGALRSHDLMATCRIALRFVHPTKQIRWKAWSPVGMYDPDHIDFAPNGRGWYV